MTTKYREPWFLSNENDAETWVITDGVETFPILLATEAEIGIAVRGTEERAVARFLGQERTTIVPASSTGSES